MNPRGFGLLQSALLIALLGSLPGCATQGPDPLERWNRPIFSFNERFDKYVLEPAATGWDWVLPEVVQTGIRNFYDNITMPVTLANDILQLKPRAALEDLGRITVNTTAGIGGLLDVASMIEIPENDEDFGQTLGRYGVPPGPYLIIPLLGPSTARDVFRYPADAAVTPHNYFLPGWASLTLRIVENFNIRAYYLEELREARAAAFDYYAFVRSAYLEVREHKVRDATVETRERRDDLYQFEDQEAAERPSESGDDLYDIEDD
jgi:phospholipid-binding lipoprotein MlaA